MRRPCVRAKRRFIFVKRRFIFVKRRSIFCGTTSRVFRLRKRDFCLRKKQIKSAENIIDKSVWSIRKGLKGKESAIFGIFFVSLQSV